MVSGIDTRQQLLDAAETLFAQHGIQATSLRAITSAADANLAAVNYHFGSKDGLVRAVFQRRLEPINSERLRLLDTINISSLPPRQSLDAIWRAFFEPPLRLGREQGEERLVFKRLMGRAFYEPDTHVRAILREQFGEILRRFGQALKQTLPTLAEPEIAWRLHFAAGALAHVTCNQALVEELSDGLCIDDDLESMIQRLVEYTSSGFLGGTGHRR